MGRLPLGRSTALAGAGWGEVALMDVACSATSGAVRFSGSTRGDAGAMLRGRVRTREIPKPSSTSSMNSLLVRVHLSLFLVKLGQIPSISALAPNVSGASAAGGEEPRVSGTRSGARLGARRRRGGGRSHVAETTTTGRVDLGSLQFPSGFDYFPFVFDRIDLGFPYGGVARGRSDVACTSPARVSRKIGMGVEFAASLVAIYFAADGVARDALCAFKVAGATTTGRLINRLATSRLGAFCGHDHKGK